MPLAALAQPGGVGAGLGPSTPPIAIDSCAPELDASGNQSVAGFALAARSRGMAIHFTNESRKTASLVNFAITSNGEQFVIRDVGTFSPGAAIEHTYRNGAGQAFVLPAFIAPKLSCEVASVKFTDGTVWRRGQASATAPNAAPPANAPPLAENAAPAATGAPGSAAKAPGAAPKLTATPTGLRLDRGTDSELFLVSSSERVTAFRESDDCAAVASIFVVATGQASATYSVRPVAAGACTARVTDEAGNALDVPVVVL